MAASAQPASLMAAATGRNAALIAGSRAHGRRPAAYSLLQYTPLQPAGCLSKRQLPRTGRLGPGGTAVRKDSVMANSGVRNGALSRGRLVSRNFTPSLYGLPASLMAAATVRNIALKAHSTSHGRRPTANSLPQYTPLQPSGRLSKSHLPRTGRLGPGDTAVRTDSVMASSRGISWDFSTTDRSTRCDSLSGHKRAAEDRFCTGIG
uniref:Uncharacterized protein n=1 Tax=Myotis myotis TaxID=51298 RepID=A0A7J7R3W8_MYOMY|nr:hypothetical protein mMyoMyo1_010913 [Myotis myotis]